jgi:PAS domain S-box-containing protein
LSQAQQQTEELRAQEEELRQNMEEINTIRDDIEQKNISLASQMRNMELIKLDLETRTNIINKTTLVTESDLYGNMTYVNEKFCQVSKYTKEECIGKPHSMLRHPDNPKSLFKELWETIKSGKIFQGTYPNRAKDGSTYWVEATIAPVFNEKNEIIKYIGVRYDVTESMKQTSQTQTLLAQAQQQSEELRAQEEELRQNMEELSATQNIVSKLNENLGMFIAAAEECMYVLEISPEMRLLRCNNKFLVETGYFSEELLNNNYGILMDKAELSSYKETLNDLKQGKIVKKIVKRIAKDKTELILDATYYPVMNDRKQLVKAFKLSYNITEQNNKIKNLEAKLNGNKK